jgi:acyl-CoA reductase-like NAD-dependent aldehyde dehydrogenase
VPQPPTSPSLVGGTLRRAAATRADVGAAVAAARAALPGWSGATAYDRGRLLCGVAELLDKRRDRLVAEVTAEGLPAERAEALVGDAVDRWVWFAGWTDKIGGVLGSVNPVAGPYASWSAPRPIGVIGALAPGSLLGLVDVLAPVLAAGATAVVVAERSHMALVELLAVSELPAGVANLLAGDVAALAPELGRAGVDGLDLVDAPAEPAAELQRAAAETLTRALLPSPSVAGDPGLARLRAWSEVATVWHPIGR